MALDFRCSERATLGVEWELALVDRSSRDLENQAPQVLRALAGVPGLRKNTVHRELLLNTIEVVTGICDTVPEAMCDLNGTLGTVRGITDALGLDLFCAGTHPFARWADQEVTEGERYARLIDRTQWWGRQMLIYGVHVHVGVRSVHKVMPMLDTLLNWFPHLQALSASAPTLFTCPPCTADPRSGRSPGRSPSSRGSTGSPTRRTGSSTWVRRRTCAPG